MPSTSPFHISMIIHKMKKYRVLVEELHISHMVVEAESPEEAKEKIMEGEGVEVSLEYGDTLKIRDVIEEMEDYDSGQERHIYQDL